MPNFEGGSVEIQIKSTADKARIALEALSASVKHVRGNLQSLVPVFNSINKLANGLRTIEKLDMGKVSTQIDAVGDSLGRMSANLARTDLSGFNAQSDMAAQALNRLTNSFRQLDKLQHIDTRRVYQDLDRLGRISSAGVDKLSKALNSIDLSGVISTGKALNNLVNGLHKIQGLKLDTDITGNLKAQLDILAPTLTTFLQQLQGINTDGLQRLMSALKALPKAMEAMQALDTAKLGTVFSTLATQVQPFLAQLKEAGAELRDFAFILKSLPVTQFTSSVKTVQNAVKNIGLEAKKSESAISKMFTVGKLYFLINYTKRLGQNFVKMATSAIDFIEVENLFSRSLGSARNEALRFQNTLSEAFGLALPGLMKAQGIFNNILITLGGINEEVSGILSADLTKMAIDFSALYNVSVDDAIEKFEAALVGQTKPIRSVSGMDITQATLQTYLDAAGIDRKVRSLTQMEKRLLIIHALQEQMARSGAIGAWAQEIENPANQLKILSEQLKEVGRWISAVFIGVIGNALPYINGFVMAIKEIVRNLALLVGYKMPETDVSTALDVGGAEDDIDKATDAMKELKNASTGIDELNIIAPQQGAEDTGPIGGVDPAILNLLEGYDNLMDTVRMKAHEIRDAILEWYEKFKEDPFGTIVGGIWKFVEGLANLALKLAAEIFKPENLKNVALGLEILVGALLASMALGIPFPLALALSAIATSGLMNLLGKDLAIGLLGGALTGLATALLLTKVGVPLPIAIALGALAGALVWFLDNVTNLNFLAPALMGVATSLLLLVAVKGLAPIAAIILGIAVALASFTFLNELPVALDVVLLGIAGALTALGVAIITNKAALGASLIAAALGSFGPILAIILPGIAAAVGLFVAFSDLSPGLTAGLGAIAIALGAIGTVLAIATGGLSLIIPALVGLAAAIVGTFTAMSKDALPEVKRFSDGISEETKKAVEPLIDLADTARSEIVSLFATSEPLTAENTSKISGYFKEMADTAIGETERMKNMAIENLAAIWGDQAQTYEEELRKSEKFYNDQIDQIKKKETALSDAVRQAALDLGTESEEYKTADKAHKDYVAGMEEDLKRLSDARDADTARLTENFKAQNEESNTAYINARNAQVAHYDGMKADTEAQYSRLQDLLKKKITDGKALTVEEQQELNRLQEEFLLDTEKAMGASNDELVSLAETRKEDMLRIQADEAVDSLKKAKSASDDKIKEANDHYAQALKDYKKANGDHLTEADFLKTETGKKIKAMTDEQIAEAKRNYEETVDNFKKIYPDIEGVIDTESPKIKSKWTTFWEDVGTWFSGFWDRITGKTKKGASDVGDALTDGLVEGVDKTKTENAWEGALSDTVTAGNRAMEINSPSKVTERQGDNLIGGLLRAFDNGTKLLREATAAMMLGVSLAISDSAPSALQAFKDLFNDIFDLTETFANEYINAIRKMVEQQAKLLMSLPGAAPIIVPAPSYVKIPRFLRGGFPEDGFFFANHNELIGSVAGQTAVANNEMIVTALEGGVERAMLRAMAQAQPDNRPIVVEIDGREVVRAERTASSDMGRNPIGGAFANA